MMQVQRHEYAGATPNNTDDCKNVPGINGGLPMKYDTSCPGESCFESYPCRYCTEGCPCNATFALAQRVGYTPNNTDDCKNVPGINGGLPMKYDTSCPGECCFESYPCRYCTEGCPCNATSALAQREATNKVFAPNNTEECKKVDGINTDID